MVDEDRHVTVRFYHGAVLNQAKTDAAGRRIYDDHEMCEIKFPGDPSRSIVGPAHDRVFMHRPRHGEEPKGHLSYAERFADTYKAWKSNDPAALRTGTPLEHLPFMTPAKVYELKAQNIHTAEALTRLSESVVAKLAARSIVEQAKVYLGDAEASATVAKAEAEKAAVEARFDALMAEIDALKKGKPAGDEFEAMTDDDLRAWLAANGANPRANAARDKMLLAAREIAQMMAA
jgi:hypothetical protein